MKTELAYYDIYPKVLLAHSRAGIAIRPLGAHAAFEDALEYTVSVIPMNETNLNDRGRPYPAYQIKPHEGSLFLSHEFGAEGQYQIVITPGDDGLERKTRAGLRPLELRVYAVEADLHKLRPFRGDLHIHTCHSDGRESPAIVAANYRRAGFDFIAITDHVMYDPSLEAIEVYRDVPLDLCLLPGEEIHAPGNNTHYLHAGGKYSVNALIRGEKTDRRSPWDQDNGPLSDQYRRETKEIMDSLEIPAGLNKEEYASCVWICREIRKADGLSMMVHPHWINGHAYHIPEVMAAYMMKSGLFDAFELISGMKMQENLAQVNLWREMRAQGCNIPVLGNSDSHGTVNSEWFNVSKSIVFSERCQQESLFEAIRSGRSVALEQYAGESAARVYGGYRYVPFAAFLLDEYFPLHDELCFEEGRLMKEYVTGDRESAKTALKSLHGRTGKLLEKYWAAQG